MTDAHDFSATSQLVAALQHDKLKLQSRLTNVQSENQMLRRQLYQMNALLDLAVSKLSTMGINLETPLDIRAMRAEAAKRTVVDETERKAGFDAGALSVGSKSEESGVSQKKKRFQLRTQLREHTKAVQCCAFASGDDPLIVTAGLDRRLVLQNFYSLQVLWDLRAHDEMVSDVAWFDSTRNILSASYDSTVKLWDPQSSERAPLYQLDTAGFVLSAPPLDKAYVFACSDSRHRTYIADVRTPKPIASWEHASRVNSIAFDNSTGHMLMGHSDGHVSVWDIRRVRSSVASTSAAVTAANTPPETSTGTAAGAATGSSASLPATGSIPDGTHSATSTHGGGAARQSLPPLLTPEKADGQAAAAAPAASPPAAVEGSSKASSASNPSAGLSCVSRFSNEASRAAVSFLGHYYSSDDTKRLVCVSDDNIVRVYRGNLNAPVAGRSNNDLYHLRNVLPGVPARGFPVRAGFWKGNRDKAPVSDFLDDGERDVEQTARKLTECDLLVTGGPENTALVFDISEDAGCALMERLEGHRDRVTGASVHHSDNRPIIATTSVDSIVRIWVPAKT